VYYVKLGGIVGLRELASDVAPAVDVKRHQIRYYSRRNDTIFYDQPPGIYLRSKSRPNLFTQDRICFHGDDTLGLEKIIGEIVSVVGPKIINYL
jgi:hypothetical protein